MSESECHSDRGGGKSENVSELQGTFGQEEEEKAGWFIGFFNIKKF